MKYLLWIQITILMLCLIAGGIVLSKHPALFYSVLALASVDILVAVVLAANKKYPTGDDGKETKSG